MKLKFIILTALLGSCASSLSEIHPSYNPKDWPLHILSFPKEGTLKDVFDSGIRPYRFPSLETSTLEFKHVRVSVELKSGEKLPPIDVEWGNIKALQDNLLSTVEITTPKLTPKEAQDVMLSFLGRGNRTVEALTEFVESAAKDPRNYDDPYDDKPDGFLISWNDVDGANYAVFFKSSYDTVKPLAFSMKISFFPIRTPIQERSFYKIKIPPPPGYEDVSMEAPRNFGPDSAIEIARSRGEDTGESAEAVLAYKKIREKELIEYARSQRQAKHTPPAARSEASQKSISTWWLVSILLLLLSIAALISRRFLRFR